MTTYQVVTTCHAQGWMSYGRRMVMTFNRMWPKSIGLALYADGFSAQSTSLIELRSLPMWQHNFKQRNKSIPEHNGLNKGKAYNMLFDAVRFSHKVGAITDAAEKTEADVLIWIDADVVTHAPVTEEFLNRLMPPDVALSWLWRSHKYPETGFIMFNMRHPLTPTLMAALRRIYEDDAIFHLDHWTDCHALEAVVRRLDAPAHSLSGSYHNTGHPFINGVLGTVMDHLKGARKQVGRSRRIDLKFRREEAYWRGVR